MSVVDVEPPRRHVVPEPGTLPHERDRVPLPPGEVHRHVGKQGVAQERRRLLIRPGGGGGEDREVQLPNTGKHYPTWALDGFIILKSNFQPIVVPLEPHQWCYATSGN